MNKRYHIIISGTVQGVGFRYTAKSLARENNVTGWIRNLSNGRVEMEIQGNDSQVQDFLNSLQNEFKSHIQKRDTEEVEALDEERFDIRT